MSSMQIYLARNNAQAGPYSLEQVNNMLASGEVLLEDLAWHGGIDSWKKLGELTHGQYFYDPNNSDINNSKLSVIVDVTKGGMTQNHEHPNNERKNKLTVDQLYGRKPVSENKIGNDTKADKNNGDKPETHIIRIQVPTTDLGENELATISSRILAVIIDQIALIIAVLPMVMQVGLKEFSKPLDIAQVQKLVESISPETALLTSMLILLVFVIQIVLLITRGQSIGKLLVGIRILNFESKRLASVTNVLLIRTIVFNIAYSLPLVGVPILIVDFVNMMMDSNKRSLHDKMAKTFVVKATAEQLDKQKLGDSDNKSK